jgi:hypothetical protein
MKKSLKKFLFNITPAQILFSLAVVIGFIGFIVFRLVSGFVGNVSGGGASALSVLTMLTIALLLSRLSIIVTVGIGFLPFILFGVQMVFGPLVSLAMVVVTTAIYLKIAVKPYWFDFLITKGVASAMAQLVYLGLWTVAMIGVFHFLTVEYIMSNLVFVYMISIVIYVAFMVVCLPMLAREPVPKTFINGMMMFVFQYFLIKYTGLSFMNYIMALKPV